MKKIGNVVVENSLKHYIVYFLSKKIASAFQNWAIPKNSILYRLKLKGFFNKKIIFLQHGIVKEYLPTLFYNVKKYDLFICGAEPEYNYIKEKFGYPDKNLAYTGLARYDALHESVLLKNEILLIPTWRQWLGLTSLVIEREKDIERFLTSNYYKTYESLINNYQLHKFLEENNYQFLFYLHPETQRFRKYFKAENSRIKIVSREDVVLQDLLKTSRLLITDYSSVAFDFGYMNKPILYYQFDTEEYYRNHYQKGYFDYEKNGFGKVVSNENILIQEIEKIKQIKGMPEIYKQRKSEFFKIYDNCNCCRIYKAIKDI